MQTNFIFVDTETKTEKIDETEILTFKLGCFVYWDKINDFVERQDFFEIKDFWDYVENVFVENHHLILYAHNADFDFKILNGYQELINRGWKVKNWYIQGRTFIIKFEFGEGKNKKVLDIWDSMNYVPFSLKVLGKYVGLEKLEIDFNKNTQNELLVYCRRDTEIIFRFIKYLISFLEEYELSKLKPTSASLSLNIFRHKFYSRKKEPIYIHDWKKSIQLERKSYSGGITDCFKVGKIKQKVYKLDINSMYPYIMQNYSFPVRLVFWGRNPTYSKQELKQIFEEYSKTHSIILSCKIFLPKEYAYILQKAKVNKQSKSIFLCGEFETVLTSPEINFVKKFGKIIEIYEISVYEKAILFKNFVDFFYKKRLEFKQQKNFVYEQFCKLILNSLYGKWGQKSIKYTIQAENLSNSRIKNFGSIIDAETGEHFNLIQFGTTLYKIQMTEQNSKDSFVAISSFVTSYSRMLLIKYLLTAKRENCFYCDTDSLFVNEKGYKNLINFVDKDKLGFLKLEEISKNVIIYKPKFYEFGKDFKCKGIKKGSKLIKETPEQMFFKMARWERFKTALKNENIDKQIITQFEKIVNKTYDKGFILLNGIVEPYDI